MLVLASQRKSISLVNDTYFSTFAHARSEHQSDSS